ncbi:hypothetical protein Y013_20985 [Rhodococcus pyridinivorans SB3094]|uniref:Uncharacterized protein n=1 Tax=Rhodococcus pyridinivorans SB3094 TaxID=1435356 RepID=V9XKA7_9NOCA|nr:hypothetical protein Y013_20985 [Rhodococcus pyridinivorans SB3094]
MFDPTRRRAVDPTAVFDPTRRHAVDPTASMSAR